MEEKNKKEQENPEYEILQVIKKYNMTYSDAIALLTLINHKLCSDFIETTNFEENGK